MSTLQFPGVVRAARAKGQEQKALAESLYREIPPRGRGRRPAGEPTVNDLLERAVKEIQTETGETYSAVTLRDYRNVAAWVAGNNSGTTVISWADASWTAHQEAFAKGMSFEKFLAGGRTKRAARTKSAKGEATVTDIVASPEEIEDPKLKEFVKRGVENSKERAAQEENGEAAMQHAYLLALSRAKYLAEHERGWAWFGRLRIEIDAIGDAHAAAEELTPEMFQ